MAVSMRSLLLLFFGILFQTVTSDFDIGTHGQAGYEFIYHQNHHLLLTIHGTGCYYAYIHPHYYDSMIANFRSGLQGLVIAAVEDSSNSHKRATTLPEVLRQFGDPPANTKCAGHDIYVIEPDFVNCTFESVDQRMCAWRADSPGDLYWEPNQGETQTILTGPLSDHTLRGTDHPDQGTYVYVEANNGSPGDYAELVSPTLDITNGLCLKFWYSMYGDQVGMLQVFFIADHHPSYDPVWTVEHNQGQEWRQAEVTVLASSSSQSQGQIYIRATRGSGQYADIAIDDISSTPGICTHTLLRCKFNRNLCHWTQVAVFDQLDWKLATINTNSTSGHGPLHGGWDGGDYLLMDGYNKHPGDRAELQTPVLHRPDPLCLTFHYYMDGDGVGELDVVLLDEKTQAETLLWTRTHQDISSTWQNASVTVPSPGPDILFQLLFRATRGSSDYSDIAIDDISSNPGICQLPPSVLVG